MIHSTVDCTKCKQEVRVKVNRVYANANWKLRAEIIDYTSNMHWTHKLLTGRAFANICLRLQTNFSRARRRLRRRIQVETGLCTYFLISMLSPSYLCSLAYWCAHTAQNVEFPIMQSNWLKIWPVNFAIVHSLSALHTHSSRFSMNENS